MAIEPHLFRGINEQIFQKTKEDKKVFEGAHIEIRDQSIKKEAAFHHQEEEEKKDDQPKNDNAAGLG